MTDGHKFMIHLGSNTFHPYLTVHSKSKIKGCRPNRQHLYIPFWSIDIYFFSKKASFKIMKEIHRIHFLVGYHFPYLSQPLIKSVFFICPLFIFPMCCQTLFGYFIHPLGSNLHFHPFPLGTHYCSMKSLIPITFWIT